MCEVGHVGQPFLASSAAMTEEPQTQTQTQTQGEVEWSQGATPSIPVIWGRLYRTGNKCWRNETGDQMAEYLDLIAEEFKVGRATTCNFMMKKDNINEDIIKNVSKLHFILKRSNFEALTPAVLLDCSYNGTFVNGIKIGKGKSRVLDDNDEIAITHPHIKIFIFKDLQKNEQDQVPKEISQKYYISRTLGQGACGIVKLVYNKMTCQRYAMKIIKKNRITNAGNNKNNLNNPKKIMNEVRILQQLRHPCIISTEEIFEARDAVYIILEFMEGGELFERITKLGRLSERQTQLLFRQMVLAVQYLHSEGITHRDLKPENVLLEGNDEETIVKISDFGLSKLVGEDSFMKTMCGTPLYLAPEILEANGLASYGPEVDVWSLGVIFFICLSGYLPFSSDYPGLTLREQILQGRYMYSEPQWRGVSLQAKFLMRRMLTVKPERRITLAGILDAAWMQSASVISRVEELLKCTQRTLSQLSITSQSNSASNSDEENKTVVSTTHNAKRALSSSFSSCEPMPKKMRLGMHPFHVSKKEPTDSTTSVDTDDENYLLIIQ